jgi:hypothetical protein
MLDNIDSQRATNSLGYDLGEIVFGKDYNSKKQAEVIYAKYNPKTSMEKMDAILQEIPEQQKRYDILSRCFGINDLKTYYYKNRERVDTSKMPRIYATYDTFLFYVTMISYISL